MQANIQTQPPVARPPQPAPQRPQPAPQGGGQMHPAQMSQAAPQPQGQPQGGGEAQAFADLAQNLTPQRFGLLMKLMVASFGDAYSKLQSLQQGGPAQGQPPAGGAMQ